MFITEANVSFFEVYHQMISTIVCSLVVGSYLTRM